MLKSIFYFAQDCTASSGNVIGGQCLPQTPASDETLKTLFLMAFVIIGAVATLFIIIAGIRYITAGGDPQKIQTAKNEIKYALIGLVIAGMGAAIVNFVIDRLV